MSKIPPTEKTAVAKLNAVKTPKNKDAIDEIIKKVESIKNLTNYKDVGNVVAEIWNLNIIIENEGDRKMIEKYIDEYASLILGRLYLSEKKK